MLVSHAHRFVFLKTRKTAGTSVEMLLQPCCTTGDGDVTERTHAIVSDDGIVGMRMIPDDECTELDRRWHHHLPAAAIRDGVGAETFDSYRRIVTVRNPFDRAVSQFYFRRQDDPIVRDDFSRVRTAFIEFVTGDDWPDDREIVFVDDAFVATHPIRYEHLADDVAALVDDLGLPVDATRMSVTKRTSHLRSGHTVADHFDAAAIAVVRRRLAWVFDRFDYSPDPNT